jgi:hypothetical protein
MHWSCHKNRVTTDYFRFHGLAVDGDHSLNSDDAVSLILRAISG